MRTIKLTDKQYEIVVALVEAAACEAADLDKSKELEAYDEVLETLDGGVVKAIVFLLVAILYFCGVISVLASFGILLLTVLFYIEDHLSKIAIMIAAQNDHAKIPPKE